MSTAEQTRLDEATTGVAPWRRWGGTYLSERAWGSVREDYSADGDAWAYFPFDHARSRAYRWSDDGLAGWCDDEQTICLGVALWNGHDRILKERPYGVANEEGNHGEDVKDYWFYTDNLPTHAYASLVYKYPQAAFPPYDDLLRTNQQRGPADDEYELFEALRQQWLEQRYFDVEVAYAKDGPEDVFCRITVTNRGPDAAPIHVLPQLWYRNTWSWDPTRTGRGSPPAARGGGAHLAPPQARPAVVYGHQLLRRHSATGLLRERDQQPAAVLLGQHLGHHQRRHQRLPGRRHRRRRRPPRRGQQARRYRLVHRTAR